MAPLAAGRDELGQYNTDSDYLSLTLTVELPLTAYCISHCVSLPRCITAFHCLTTSEAVLNARAAAREQAALAACEMERWRSGEQGSERQTSFKNANTIVARAGGTSPA